MRYHFIPVRMAIIKKSANNKCWWGCGVEGTLVHVGAKINWCNHYGKKYGGPQKSNRTTIWSNNLLLGI